MKDLALFHFSFNLVQLAKTFIALHINGQPLGSHSNLMSNSQQEFMRCVSI